MSLKNEELVECLIDLHQWHAGLVNNLTACINEKDLVLENQDGTEKVLTPEQQEIYKLALEFVREEMVNTFPMVVKFSNGTEGKPS